MEARPLEIAVAEAIGTSVVSSSRLSGGDFAEAACFDLADGRSVFVKTHRDPPANFFTTEAQGLTWLAEPDVLPVPRVIAVSDHRPAFLILDWIDTGRGSGTSEGEIEFGRRLAMLHRTGFEQFGRSDRRTTGSRALPNEPCDSWVEFFRTQRLEPLLALARSAGALPDDTIASVEWIADHLDELGVPVEPAARLHGDLWAGNRVVDVDGRSWIIDPACHGGHREFDLAMMQLFGGFGAECFDGYDDEFPLADGWLDRIPLHQLAPLIVHAIKFGGGYAAATERAATAVRRLRSGY